MIVRIYEFAYPNCPVSISSPVNTVEELDYVMNRLGWNDIQHFDCDSSELPLFTLSDGTCQRCSWVCDMVNKKVVVKQPCDCIHNKLLVLDKILDDPLAFRQDKLNALLDRELLIRSNSKR